MTGTPNKPRKSKQAPAPAQKQEDVALVCGVSQDGKGLSILRKRGEKVEAGTVRALEEGKPLHGELVRLKPRSESPLLCDVEVDFELPASARPASHPGPAQVATEQYRKGWDAIYKRSRSSKPDNTLN